MGIGGQQQQNLDDWDLLNLFFTSCDYDKEIVWLISSYLLYVWENVFVRGAEVKLEKFFWLGNVTNVQNWNCHASELEIAKHRGAKSIGTIL